MLSMEQNNLVGAGSLGELKSLAFVALGTNYWISIIPPSYTTSLQSNTILCLVTNFMAIASALDYMHKFFHNPIVHCGLNPSNILSHNDMNACVGDFGLARYLPNPLHAHESAPNAIMGSIGYIASCNAHSKLIRTLPLLRMYFFSCITFCTNTLQWYVKSGVNIWQRLIAMGFRY